MRRAEKRKLSRSSQSLIELHTEGPRIVLASYEICSEARCSLCGSAQSVSSTAVGWLLPATDDSIALPSFLWQFFSHI